MNDTMTLKGLHDRLLAEKPEGAVHEPCVLCAMTDDNGGTDGHKGGSVSDQTYTEDELKSELAKATAALEARVKELETSQQVSEVESRVAAIKAEKDAEIADIQRQLDEAVLQAAGERLRADAIVEWLEAEKTAAEQAAEQAARRDERLAKVKEVANFPEEYLVKHADRFAAMTDEDFEAHVEGLREIAAAAGLKPAGSTLPDKTGLHAARDDNTSTRSVGSATKEIFALRRSGRIDLSTL
jgi:hypothetical protein